MPMIHQPAATTTRMAPPSIGLYIHFPWCQRKCPYCDFNSHQRPTEFPEEIYIDALLWDLERAIVETSPTRIETIFMGGGTPSLFAPHLIERLLEGIRKRAEVSPSAEITLEANPGSVDQEKFKGYRAAGINRLSLGIQSFQDPFLKALGRIHTGQEALRAAESALAAGFSEINLDLMCVFHGIRPCIPRTSGHLFHADSATRFEGFCQAVGAKRRRSLGRLIHPPVTVKRGSVYSSPFSLF